MNDIVNKKDTNGLYQYIINNINDKNIKVLWKALREYTENGTYQEELYNKERGIIMRYRIKIIRKVNHLMRFIGSLNRASKKEFDKYCKSKEIKL